MVTHSSILAWRIPWTEEPGSPRGRKELDTTEQLHSLIGPLTPVLKGPKPLWPLPTCQESFPLTLGRKHELEVAGCGKFVLALNPPWFAPNHP